MLLNHTFNSSCTKNDIDFFLKIQLIVGGWLSTVACILGLFANTFSIIVLINKRMRTLSTNIYLIALAIVNLIWLILFLIFYALRYTIIIPYFISENQENLYSSYNQMYHRLSPYSVPLMNTLQLCIIYYTVAVSVDRYLYISMGVHVSQYCTVRNALRVVSLLTIFAIGFLIPNWFKYCVKTQIDRHNRTHYKTAYTRIGEQKMFREIVNIYLFVPVVHTIPFVTLIVIIILTIRRLIRYHNEHRRLLSTSIRQMTMIQANVADNRRHFHVTIMLIGVVVLFLLCRVPMLVNQIYEVRYSLSEGEKSRKNSYFQCRIQRPLNTFANFMQAINSNGNLIIYSLCCQTFRETLRELLEKLGTLIRLKSSEHISLRFHIHTRTNTRSSNL